MCSLPFLIRTHVTKDNGEDKTYIVLQQEYILKYVKKQSSHIFLRMLVRVLIDDDWQHMVVVKSMKAKEKEHT